jgi:signal transduction histidine kinase
MQVRGLGWATGIRQRPGAVALAVWLGLAALAAVALWQLRSNSLEAQSRELSLLSLALSDEVDRGLQGAEEGMRAMQLELQEGRLPLAGPEAEKALATRAALMPLVSTLWLVGTDGRPQAASDTTPPPALDTFSPPLRTLADDASAVSRPFLDTDGTTALVALATRLTDTPGVPGGWIIAAMPADTLRGAFAVATPAADARVAVFRNDRVRLAGALISTAALDEANVAEQLAVERGATLVRFRNGGLRLVSSRHLSRYGLTLLMTRDAEAMMSEWRAVARLAGGGLLLVGLVLTVSMLAVQRADHRRAIAQRALQAQLARDSKLEALGTLAGGVAHDFNNVLAAIVGYGEMAQDAAIPGSAQARHLDTVLQAAQRGQAFIERILAFSRGGPQASTVFELAPLVEEVLTLLSSSLRPGLILERAMDASGARLRGDPTQAYEAIMNLCTNAMQAMPEGGVLGVRVARQQVAAPLLLSHGRVAAGHYLALSVSDQGRGIAPEVMAHLFEPFFTTRRADAGTGLGLAVVHGVVTALGGAIDVLSTPGHGARFTLYLPESHEPPSTPARDTHEAADGGGQRVLVVDDEPALAALATEWLAALGYAPVAETDPAHALQMLRATPGHFAAVITDEVMPGLSGTQFTEQLRRFAPQLPVLLVSGYGGVLLAQRAATAGVNRVLAKPLRRADLARHLAELLH